MSQAKENVRLLIEPTAEKATQLVATIFRTTLCERAAQSQPCRVALAGGTTPHALYQTLARYGSELGEPWQWLEIFFGDERTVPHDHIESNYHMVQRAMLDHVPIDLARVHPMPADADDLDTAAALYERVIRERVPAGPGGVPSFDLILLGMGGDGHTASLFPHTAALDETTRLVVSHFVPVLGRNRMTFTFPLINAAQTVMLLVTGEDKADAVADLLGSSPTVPAARVRPAHGLLYVVLDSAAARKMPR